MSPEEIVAHMIATLLQPNIENELDVDGMTLTGIEFGSIEHDDTKVMNWRPCMALSVTLDGQTVEVYTQGQPDA